MAGSFRVDGLISGLDTTDIVSKYMQIERQPITKLENKKATLNAKADAWREMNSRLYKLRDAVYKLQSILTFRGKTVTNSNPDLLSITAEDNALISSYKIEVGKLAQAQSLASSNISVSSTEEALGLSGTLKITVNGVEKEITVDAEDTLQSLVQKINNTQEIGVTASAILVGTGEFKLTLTSKETGLANQIDIAGDLADTLAFTETQAAQDAEL
ncbi:MAG TPA: flagellar cap protein FliD N-terminal domain-containing protein, partial [Bacillota bacterium]